MNIKKQKKLQKQVRDKRIYKDRVELSDKDRLAKAGFDSNSFRKSKS